MSYEGYIEYITNDGKYYQTGIFTDITPEKPYWVHDVNITNGYEEDNPNTCEADKIEIEPEEIKTIDHKGNPFFRLIKRWKPDSPHWRLIK
jgi:hypothetical protein